MLFYVLIVCTVTLPPSVNPIAVDKYIYLDISDSYTTVWKEQKKILHIGPYSCLSWLFDNALSYTEVRSL